MSDANLLVMNGNELAFEPGETLLDVATRNGIDIPTLCHLKGTTATGACRICVVEVEGARTLLAACATPAGKNMVVRTESPVVVEARRTILKLMLSSGNHNCAARGSDPGEWTAFQLSVESDDRSPELCPIWGDCRLQDLAYRYQVTGEEYPRTRTRYPLEDVNPFIVRDFSRCILCGRCVQACNEVQVNQAISFGFRGAETKIIAAGDKPYRDSDCVFCGECIQVCPVAALMEKDVRYRHRPWEMTPVRTTCTYCGVGCQMDLQVKDGKVVKIAGAREAVTNRGSLCVKGRFGFDFIHSEERLKSPLIREGEGFREASWDEALGLVARRLGDIRDQHGSDTIGLMTSARVTNEENYLAQKFARGVLKTNNVDHCARL